MQAAANFVQDTILGKHPTEVTAAEGQNVIKGEKMKALAWYGNRDVRIVDAAVPDITDPDDVIIKVTGSTICGSDLHLYNSEIMTMKKGDILGHEFMGKVWKVGPDVHNLKVGQRVVASFQVACGKCGYCKQKLSSFCDRTNDSSLMNTMYGHRDAGFFGYSHFTGGFAGGQAEYVRIPYGNVNLLPIPDNVSDEKALYLSDVLPTSYHCVVDTGVQKGDVVGVWGLGPIGLCVIKWCFIKGAKRVIAIDRVPERLEMARQLGAETIDFSAPETSNVITTIHKLCYGGLDVSLDCGSFHNPKTMLHKVEKALMLETDVPEILNECIVATRKMGKVGVIAAYAGITNHFNIGALMEKGIRFIGNGQAPVHKYWEEILNDYIITGKFDPTFMITHRVSLDQMPELYREFNARNKGIEKVFVETKFSDTADPSTPALTNIEE